MDTLDDYGLWTTGGKVHLVYQGRTLCGKNTATRGVVVSAQHEVTCRVCYRQPLDAKTTTAERPPKFPDGMTLADL